jgi:hypothetical protein
LENWWNQGKVAILFDFGDGFWRFS